MKLYPIKFSGSLFLISNVCLTKKQPVMETKNTLAIVNDKKKTILILNDFDNVVFRAKKIP